MLGDALLVMVQALLALWLTACTFASAHRIAWRCVGPAPTALRWSAVAIVGIALAFVGFFALLPLRLFLPLPAAIAASLCTAGVLRWVPGPSPSELLAREVRIVRRVLRPTRPIHWLAAIGLAGPAVLAGLRTLAGPPLAWDTMTYHGVRAALFVQNQFQFEPGPGSWSLYRHFFAGGEVLVAWAMLPFHSDLLAGFVNAVEWLALGVACFALARELGVRGGYASLSAWACLTLPALRLQVPSGYVELPMALCVVASLAFAVHALRTERATLAGLALIAAGAAVAIKFVAGLALAAVALTLTSWAANAWRHGQRRPALAVALGLLGAAALIAPWLVEPWRETGYPLSPIPLSLFGITLGVADPALVWNRMHDTSAAYTLAAEWAALRAVFLPSGAIGTSLGPFALLPLFALVPGALRLRRRSPRAAGLLVALVGLMVAFVYLPTMNVNRLYWPRANSRYIVVAVLIATPLALSSAQASRIGRALVVMPLAVGAALYSLVFLERGVTRFDSAVVATASIGALGLFAITTFAARRSRGAGVGIAIVGVACGLAVLAHARDAARYSQLTQASHHHAFPRYWRAAAEAVDDPSTSRRIAITAGPHQDGDNWYGYFFLGRTFQNTLHYVPVTHDGDIAHFGARSDRRERADAASWLARLDERGVDDVMSFRPRSLELRWMEARPERFRKIAGAADWGLYRIVRESSDPTTATGSNEAADVIEPPS